MLTVSQPAPDFSSPNQTGDILSLKDFTGKTLILYFYPKDDTPGCTLEANDFTALASEFAAANAVVLGVSKDDCTSHQAFIDKFGLAVDLLSDTSGEVCEAYGVWQMKEKNGMSKMGIVRSTFIIDAKGILTSVEYGVKPEGHAQAVLSKIA